MAASKISLDTSKLLGWRKYASGRTDASKVGAVKAGAIKLRQGAAK